MNLVQAQIVPVTAGSGYFASQSSNVFHNAEQGMGIKVFINVTSAGSGSITPVISYFDANSIQYPALSGAAITSNGKTVLTIHPSLTAVTNVTLNDVIPSNLKIDINANNANVMNYSAAYTILK